MLWDAFFLASLLCAEGCIWLVWCWVGSFALSGGKCLGCREDAIMRGKVDLAVQPGVLICIHTQYAKNCGKTEITRIRALLPLNSATEDALIYIHA